MSSHDFAGLSTFLVLVAAGGSYAAGARRLLARGGPGYRRRHAAAFVAALAVSLAALTGPLDQAAAERFSAHMVQHLLLTLVVAPLLVLARPVRVLHAAAGRSLRLLGRSPGLLVLRGARAALRNPVAVWCAATAALWAWHLPDLYGAALAADPLHALEHLSFVATSAATWALVWGSRPLGRPGAVLLVFATALQSGGLGAVLTFASRPLYPAHGSGPAALADQQLAGTLMWVPPGLVYLGVMAALLAGWLRELERHHPDPAGAPR